MVEALRDVLGAGDEPYAQTDRPLLPTSLWEALSALDTDRFYRDQFGDTFVNYIVKMKQNEVTRFRTAAEIDEQAGMPPDVTAWEQREYFELF